MSSSVFPSLPGLGFDVIRTPMWSNNRQTAVSGVDTLIAYWSFPKWQYELTYNFLRQGTRDNDDYSEFATLAAFFNTMMGQFDSFLYDDSDDDSVTGQGIGTGDGATLNFQLVRAMIGPPSFVEPILAPNVVSAVYVDGVVVSASNYTVNAWGTTTPGVISFHSGHAPAAGKAVTADFTYYFPCRFNDDTLTFNKFMNQLYAAKSVKFTTIKIGIDAS